MDFLNCSRVCFFTEVTPASIGEPAPVGHQKSAMNRFFVICFQPAEGRSNEKSCSVDVYVHPPVRSTDLGIVPCVGILPVPLSPVRWSSREQPVTMARDTNRRENPAFFMGVTSHFAAELVISLTDLILPTLQRLQSILCR